MGIIRGGMGKCEEKFGEWERCATFAGLNKRGWMIALEKKYDNI